MRLLRKVLDTEIHGEYTEIHRVKALNTKAPCNCVSPQCGSV